ncbi:hypothetical protein D3C75_923510 [compost metagenome]
MHLEPNRINRCTFREQIFDQFHHIIQFINATFQPIVVDDQHSVRISFACIPERLFNVITIITVTIYITNDISPLGTTCLITQTSSI